MNGYLAVVIMNIVSWFATAIVSVVAMKTTGNANWAFLMLIPALFGYSYKEGKKKDGGDE